MPRFFLTKKAKDDLIEIGRYTQNTWDLKQRSRYLSLLDAAFHDLAIRPLVGSDCNSPMIPEIWN